jgi:hypothetical protein
MYVYMEVSINGGKTQESWFIVEHPKQTWKARSGIPSQPWWSPGIIHPTWSPTNRFRNATPENIRRKHGGSIGDEYGKTSENARILYIYLYYIYITMIHIWFIMDGHWKIGGHAHRMSSWAFHGDFMGIRWGVNWKVADRTIWGTWWEFITMH